MTWSIIWVIMGIYVLWVIAGIAYFISRLGHKMETPSTLRNIIDHVMIAPTWPIICLIGAYNGWKRK